MVENLVNSLLLVITTVYQAIACWREDQRSPPGQRIDIGGYKLASRRVGGFRIYARGLIWL
jgi:hypothetical protein